jgi:probable HAF family extracellular repeat protein
MTRCSLIACAAVLLLAVCRPAAAQNYTVTDLGTLRTDNGGGGVARGVNNLGQVVGVADTNQGTRRAFLWDPGLGIRDLQSDGVTLGGSRSDAWRINDTGTIVGEANIPPSGGDPFEYSHAFSFGVGAGITDLNGQVTFLGGQNSRTTAVNASGQSCGLAQDLQGNWRAFRYSLSSGLVDMGTLGGIQSRANGLNDQFEVAGASDLADGSVRATLWTPSRGIFTFFFNRSRVSEAYDVNNAGLVVGSGLVGRNTRAFTADTVGLVFRALNGRPGARVTVAHAVNNSGRIVGWSGGVGAPVQRAVMWENRRVVDLNTRLPRRSGWVLLRALDINEEGQIVGEGRFNGQIRPFLLTPQ